MLAVLLAVFVGAAAGKYAPSREGFEHGVRRLPDAIDMLEQNNLTGAVEEIPPECRALLVPIQARLQHDNASCLRLMGESAMPEADMDSICANPCLSEVTQAYSNLTSRNCFTQLTVDMESLAAVCSAHSCGSAAAVACTGAWLAGGCPNRSPVAACYKYEGCSYEYASKCPQEWDNKTAVSFTVALYEPNGTIVTIQIKDAVKRGVASALDMLPAAVTVLQGEDGSPMIFSCKIGGLDPDNVYAAFVGLEAAVQTTAIIDAINEELVGHRFDVMKTVGLMLVELDPAGTDVVPLRLYTQSAVTNATVSATPASPTPTPVPDVAIKKLCDPFDSCPETQFCDYFEGDRGKCRECSTINFGECTSRENALEKSGRIHCKIMCEPTPAPAPTAIPTTEIGVPDDVDCVDPNADLCVENWIRSQCPSGRQEPCKKYIPCLVLAAQRGYCPIPVSRIELPPVPTPTPVPTPFPGNNTARPYPTPTMVYPSDTPTPSFVPTATPVPTPAPLTMRTLALPDKCKLETAKACVNTWVDDGCPGRLPLDCPDDFLVCAVVAAQSARCLPTEYTDLRLLPLPPAVAAPTAIPVPTALPEKQLLVPENLDCRTPPAKKCVDMWIDQGCPESKVRECIDYLVCFAVAAQRERCGAVNKKLEDVRLPPIPNPLHPPEPEEEGVPAPLPSVSSTPIPEPVSLPVDPVVVPEWVDCQDSKAKDCISTWIYNTCPVSRIPTCIEYLVCHIRVAQAGRCLNPYGDLRLPPIPPQQLPPTATPTPMAFEEIFVIPQRNTSNATTTPTASPTPVPSSSPPFIYTPTEVTPADPSKVPKCINQTLNCSGHGACVIPSDEDDIPVGSDGTCVCDHGYGVNPRRNTRNVCATPINDLCPHKCSGHGICNVYDAAPGRNFSCHCFDGYGGPTCSKWNRCGQFDHCSGHGICTRSSGTGAAPAACVCDPGYHGPKCMQVYENGCKGSCSGKGECIVGGGPHSRECDCALGFTGEACEVLDEPACLSSCSGLGECQVVYTDMDADNITSRHLPKMVSGLLGLNRPTQRASLEANITTMVEQLIGRVVDRTESLQSSLNSTMQASLGDRLQLGLGRAAKLSTSSMMQEHGTVADLAGHLLSKLKGVLTNKTATATCQCASGYMGEDCSIVVHRCQSLPCLHGYCRDGVCECEKPYYGVQCSYYNASEDAACAALDFCHGVGLCAKNGSTAECKCFDGFTGPKCASVDANFQDECPNHCSGHGRCVLVKKPHCVCDASYSGVDCSIARCGSQANGKICAGHGVCEVQGSPTYDFGCTCDSGYTHGDFDECEENVCPNACSMRGACLTNGTCVCDEGYTGTDCSMLPTKKMAADKVVALQQQQHTQPDRAAEAAGPATKAESPVQSEPPSADDHAEHGATKEAAGMDEGPNSQQGGATGMGMASRKDLVTGTRGMNAGGAGESPSPAEKTIMSDSDIGNNKAGAPGQSKKSGMKGVAAGGDRLSSLYKAAHVERLTDDNDNGELSMCLNDCSHAGQCVAGTCQCREGRAGKDCHIELPSLDDVTDQVDLDTVDLLEVERRAPVVRMGGLWD